MLESCPHHNISSTLIIQYFYEGLLSEQRNLIDAAAGGMCFAVFNTKSPTWNVRGLTILLLDLEILCFYASTYFYALSLLDSSMSSSAILELDTSASSHCTPLVVAILAEGIFISAGSMESAP